MNEDWQAQYTQANAEEWRYIGSEVERLRQRVLNADGNSKSIREIIARLRGVAEICEHEAANSDRLVS